MPWRHEEIESGLFDVSHGSHETRCGKKAVFFTELPELSIVSDNRYVWMVETSIGSGVYKYDLYCKDGTRYADGDTRDSDLFNTK